MQNRATVHIYGPLLVWKVETTLESTIIRPPKPPWERSPNMVALFIKSFVIGSLCSCGKGSFKALKNEQWPYKYINNPGITINHMRINNTQVVNSMHNLKKNLWREIIICRLLQFRVCHSDVYSHTSAQSFVFVRNMCHNILSFPTRL